MTRKEVCLKLKEFLDCLVGENENLSNKLERY